MAGASGAAPFPEGNRAGSVQELAPGLREAPQSSWLLYGGGKSPSTSPGERSRSGPGAGTRAERCPSALLAPAMGEGRVYPPIPGSGAGWVPELRDAPQPSWLLPWVTMLSAQAPCPVLSVCVILLVEALSIASCRLAAVSFVLGRF